MSRNLFRNWLVNGRIVVFAAMRALFFTSTAAQGTQFGGNLVQRLERDGRFTTLPTALEVAGLGMHSRERRHLTPSFKGWAHLRSALLMWRAVTFA